MTYNGKTELVHRVAYCRSQGIDLCDIQGKVVRHTCDNPKCVNPAHLEIGTQQDNVEDMIARNRKNPAKGERAPQARLTEDQIKEIRSQFIKSDRTYGAYALARRYGVSGRAILNIVQDKSWRHV